MAALDEPSLSVWESLSCRFTPSVLFLLLNIVIGTIALTSKVYKRSASKPDDRDYRQAALSRAPSVLDRLRSFNVNLYYSKAEEEEKEEHVHSPPLSRAPSLLDRLKSINLNLYRYNSREIPLETTTEEEEKVEFETLEEAYKAASASSAQEQLNNRSQSDNYPTTEKEKVPATRVNRKMKKSASEKSLLANVAEAIRRPATVRQWRGRKHLEEEEEEEEEEKAAEVDARADDFINKFNQQLKLQRLDSILRYKEMLSRGK